jgi:hypothetical protein
MAATNASADTETAPVSADGGPSGLARLVKLCFCSLVLLVAIFQFSENTADPDLWGHIVFGQHILQSGTIPKADFYSWTANGHPWINHEVLAEILLGGAHALWGGTGVLLLKMLVGLTTFVLALRLGGRNLSWPGRYVAWTIAALAVVEISFGFAARPQIFTALFLAIELGLLIRLHSGSPFWALGLPVLFLVWINTHGGVLAGFGLLGLTAVCTTAQRFLSKASTSQPNGFRSGTIVAIWLAVIGAGLALLCNPWRAELVRWLIGSVLWLRPQIQEWNPTPLGWDHAAFFFLLALTAFAWVFTRRPRAWWELAACAAFAFLGLRSVRNVPLFALVALALVPAHFADALARFQNQFERLQSLWQQASTQKLACVLMATASLGSAVAIFTLHKEHPLTMEVPRSRYPVAALSFIQAQGLHGRLLVFFDWGEQAIFHLPDCPPSVDGRLDTCYSRELIGAHWKLYAGEPLDDTVLNPDQADIALLLSKLPGTAELAHRPGWKLAYFDDLAAVLVRDPARFPGLSGLPLPMEGSKANVLGRAPFPDKNPRWKTR